MDEAKGDVVRVIAEENSYIHIFLLNRIPITLCTVFHERYAKAPNPNASKSHSIHDVKNYLIFS